MNRTQRNQRQRTKPIGGTTASKDYGTSYSRKYTVVRWLVFMAEIILISVIQGTPGMLPNLHGERPILLIAVAVTIAVFSSEMSGMVFAMICGLMIDVSSSNILGFYAMMLVVFGFLAGYMAVNYIKTNIITAMVWMTLAVPLILYLHFVFFYRIQHFGAEKDFFVAHYLPRMLYTWAVTPIFYFINRAISKIGPKD